MTPYKKTVAAFEDCDESKVNHLNEKHMVFNRPSRYIYFLMKPQYVKVNTTFTRHCKDSIFFTVRSFCLCFHINMNTQSESS